MRLQWTHGVRLLGVAGFIHEFAIRGSALSERPSIIMACVGMIGLHEFVKKDKGDGQ